MTQKTQTNTDLVYGIERFIEEATGYQYISWNEENWLIEIDFPLDPQYAVEEYDDGEAMAKAIVEYLEGQMLPPPDQRGVIRINGFNEHPETSIRWQKGKTVHEIYEEVSDPIDVLQIAVDYQNNKQYRVKVWINFQTFTYCLALFSIIFCSYYK